MLEVVEGARNLVASEVLACEVLHSLGVKRGTVAQNDTGDDVVGLPRADGSEDVVACVILREGAALDPEGMKDFARKNLTRYKVPRTFYHFEHLASDQLGKIRRREVQADLIALLIFAGAVFGITNILSHQSQQYAVPNLVGMKKDDAINALNDKDSHFKLGEIKEDYNDDAPEGQVIEQTPSEVLYASLHSLRTLWSSTFCLPQI